MGTRLLGQRDHGMKHTLWWYHSPDKMDSIWVGTRDFELRTQLDINPTIIDCYRTEIDDKRYEKPSSAADTEDIGDRLDEQRICE